MVADAAPTRARVDAARVRRVALSVAAIDLGLAAGVFAVVMTLGPAAPRGVVQVPWWILIALFAAAQASPLHVQMGKQTRSVSLTELPFVIGLMSVGPLPFCLARLFGGLAVELGVRRHYRQPVKLAFNSALFVSEALLGVAAYRWMALGHTASSPWGWVAAITAAVVANVPSCIAVAQLIEIVEGSSSFRRVLPIVAACIVQSAAVANIGVVASLTVMADDWAVVSLVGAVVAFVVGYRAYAAITDRHSRLQHLYTFSREITGHTDTDMVIATLLDQVRSILHADDARVVHVADAVSEELSTGPHGLLRHAPSWLLDTDGWIITHVVRRRCPLLISRATEDLAAREWLGRTGLREAMLVPLTGDGDGVVIVADRLGEIRGFDTDDLELLETLSKQAAVELRSGQLLHRLRHESLHDSVTGIPNRMALQQAVQAHLDALDTTIALGMIDLDAFKDVNDSFGHHSGDEMLTQIAARLREAVGERGDVCRFGGDEFAVALYGVTAATAASFFRGLIDRLSEPVILEQTAIEVGASIGIAVAPEQAVTWAELVRKADVAMYAAKAAGRVAVVFDDTLESSGRSRLGLVAALHRAIDDDALQIHVQPKASLLDGTVVSTEALVRWAHGELGPMPPADFIPLAERSGLIRELTAAVVDKAVAACAGWQSVAPNVGVAVNVSARCLQDDSLEAAIERALRRHRLPATLLTLEITESSIMANPERTFGLLDRLRARGLQLSIDDFGTGYSSLSYLRRLPVSEVKIDRSFVARMCDSTDDAAIVQAIVELAHTLDLTVVAEGVEEESSWALLRSFGCDLAQGYLLARPMPAAEFSGWYASHRAAAAAKRYDDGMTVRQLLPGPR